MNEPLPSVRAIASAIASVMNGSEPLRDSDLQTLANALHVSYSDSAEQEFDELSDVYSDITDDASDLQQDIAIAISHLPVGSADWIVPDLISYFDSDDQFYELAHAMVSLSFPLSTTLDPQLLAGRMQYAVLNAMVRNKDIWECDMTLADQLAARGLPVSRESIAELASHSENDG